MALFGSRLSLAARRLALLCGSHNKMTMSKNVRSFHFASSDYAAAFVNLPTPDTASLRQKAMDYLDKDFDPEKWYTDPIVSILQGRPLKDGSEQPSINTVNALGAVNGSQILATPAQVEQLKQHIRTHTSPTTDLRGAIRQIEQDLFTDWPGFLIGNQCVDFQKQDGMTEIEEAIMANVIERRLNDMLLADEAEGIVAINRQAIYVSCVSNFTNFLDLSRKTLRSLEVGIPCLILSRSNTQQHAYRWAALLVDMLEKHKVDPGMVTFLSCSVPDIVDITASCADQTGNLYTTCSRELAAQIKSNYPNTVASTGGPNTLMVTGGGTLSKEMRDAIRTSATIESSGQCTALRHAVVPPGTTDQDLHSVFDKVEHLEAAPVAIQKSMFDGVFAKHAGTVAPDTTVYSLHEETDASFKVSDDLPAPGLAEFWRKVAVDFSRMDCSDVKVQKRLAAWLNENQPISLAINGPRSEVIKLGLSMFEKTGMVVYTVGSSDNAAMPAALTCQARPQEGEIFGEFPPRSQLNTFTKFPVVTPSPNPSYDTVYTEEYLKSRPVNEYFEKNTKALLENIENTSIRGFCVVAIEYLQDVAKMNPKQGFGKSRTALWGLQRPPLGFKTYLHCPADATWDDVAPIHLLFYTTNARDQVELSVDPKNTKLINFCEANELSHTVETEATMSDRLESQSDVFNKVKISGPLSSFPMVGQFVSLYFPLGHIKSTMPDDKEFAFQARLSSKWLNTLF